MATERIDELKRWLMRERPDVKDIALDMDLIDNRILDSVTFINFVYFMEEFTGKKIPLASGSTANSFRTLRMIRDKFLEEGHHEKNKFTL